MLNQIKETANFLAKKTNEKPEVGIILGTGLGGLVEEIEINHSISYHHYSTKNTHIFSLTELFLQLHHIMIQLHHFIAQSLLQVHHFTAQPFLQVH